MSESLMRETEEKEQVRTRPQPFSAPLHICSHVSLQLLVQLQNKEQAVSELTTENDHLSSALNAAEGRLAELYSDQTRQEEDTATRLEVMEKLRIQARELERDKRELQRRYNEQVGALAHLLRGDITHTSLRHLPSKRSVKLFTITNSI